MPSSTYRSAAAVLALSLGIAMLTSCSARIAGRPTVGGDRAPVSFGPDLAVAQLDGVLLDIIAVSAQMGGLRLAVKNTYDTMPGPDNSASISDPVCAGVVFNTTNSIYRPGTYTGVRGREFDDEHHDIDEGVVSFTDDAAARQFWAATQDTWRRCAGTQVTFTPNGGGDPIRWTPRAPTRVGDVVAAISNPEGGGGYTCQHALTAKANVIIDVVTCGPDIANQALRIVNAIAAKFPK
jgi:hypothetical protein